MVSEVTIKNNEIEESFEFPEDMKIVLKDLRNHGKETDSFRIERKKNLLRIRFFYPVRSFVVEFVEYATNNDLDFKMNFNGVETTFVIDLKFLQWNEFFDIFDMTRKEFSPVV